MVFQLNKLFDTKSHIYFVGIGGIGMSAIARYFKSIGKEVSGYDKTPTPLTDELQSEGISVHFEDNLGKADSVYSDVKSKDSVLVVYTPAIPKDHSELNFFIDKHYELKKRSEVLGMITKSSYTIGIAGTHGKTTTSSMVAHILKSAGMNCTAFLGGITKNYGTNLLLGNSVGKKYTVVEADEYDRSFLALYPDLAVITSMDADHLDIYGDHSYMVESYRLYAQQVKQGGRLIYKSGLQLSDLEVEKNTYSIHGDADFNGDNIRIADHRYHFDWKSAETLISDLTSEMPGLHNVENAVAAIAVAKHVGIANDIIKSALATYNGVKRRFDYQLRTSDCVFIDDYAHHPEELRACISSVKELYPGKRVTGIFQPHLYSRTRDFAEGFAKSLSMLDCLILLDIYPARELPIPGITSEIIFNEVTCEKYQCSKEIALEVLEAHPSDVVLTLGAGDIDQLVQPIKQQLQKAVKS
ncbi:MAG: UDP-N-acetylmuramate--L-alanine ligase [Bacteroidetes bacterium]|nr:UDP-N-acetylmuramate--L-alanine ligase [Bacteroidota bacterium]